MSFEEKELILFLFTFLRISGIFFFSPFFSSKNTTVKGKIFFIFMMSALVYPVIPKDYTIVQNIGLFKLASYAIVELLVGITIGYFLLMVFSTVQIGAQMYSMGLGFSMVNVFDPVSQYQIPILGQLKYIFLLGIFFALGIHREVIYVIIDTFYKTKLGHLTLNIHNIAYFLLNNFAYFFLAAFRIAMPILALLLLINVVLGIMAKVAPQMNVFFIGMPLKLLVGFLFLAFYIPYLINFFHIMFEETFRKILELTISGFGVG